MPRATLRAGYADLALRLQESMDSGDSLSAGDIQYRLSDELQDHSRAANAWCYYITHYGDAESGEVIYSCDGDVTRAAYEITGAEGKAAKCIIDYDSAEDVVPRTIYEPEIDEADQVASMESMKSEKLYGDKIPIYERFISKKSRDNAGSGDFAGKGKSFPILKAEDVKAAASSLGRAGPGNYDTATIKANIIRIAKRKGFDLPKAWQKGGSSESAVLLTDLGAIATQLHEAGARHSAEDLKHLQTIHDTAATLGASCPDTFRMTGNESSGGNPPAVTAQSNQLTLIESAAQFCSEIQISEAARTNYPILVISPGTGTTAHYPADVLKREAAKVKPGTLMFWNHATPSEEASRPEGNLDHLAAVITSQGRYLDDGPKGPGVYAEAKVMADYAEKVAERAPHIGVSIRAGGIQDGSRVVEGKPVLKEFSYIESVDYVTRAGRGGMALAEAARNAGLLEVTEAAPAAQQKTEEVGGMDADELKALKESNTRLLERAVYQDAMLLSHKLLGEYSLTEAAKQMVVENVVGQDGEWKYLPRKDGALDSAKFGDIVHKEAKRVGKVIAASRGGRPVFGMGESVTEQPAEVIQAREAADKREAAVLEDSFARIMGNTEAAKLAAKGRAA